MSISSLQTKRSKTSPATILRNLKQWHKFNKTPVSYRITHFVSIEGFFVDHGDPNQDEESIDRLWLVVRSLKNAEGKFDYKIKKFDTIKLGRVRFRVKDFRCEQMNLTPQELYQ